MKLARFLPLIAASLCLLSGASRVFANGYIDYVSPEDFYTCNQISIDASDLMYMRQDGVSLASLMEGASSKIRRAMILSAFERPFVGPYPELVKIQAQQFRDEWTLACYKAQLN